MLFQRLSTPDRTKTQLAYMAQYFPWRDLNPGAEELIVWRRRLHMHKGILANSLDETKEFLIYHTKPNTTQEFKLCWEHNCIPTEIEWHAKSDTFILSVDLRILKTVGPIALLSFYQ